ncbi:MAG TPA: response regulator transcription factor [Steroidobacteraceae bacterium]|nr:response regulator transcription factor [Steroidobacteraceae bacterium]
MPLLLIEDDPDTARLVCEGLEESGYKVEHTADGRRGLERALDGPARGQSWDLIIADRTLPGLDGLTIVQTLRQRGVLTPILMLSALGDVDDRVIGLKAGGDDYLAKPYAFTELLARIEALLRRQSHGTPATRLQVGDLTVDLVQRRVQRSGRDIELTSREFDLLIFLMRHKGEVVSRKMLLEQVWDMHFDPQTNVVDVHMSRLRQAIDRGFEKSLIHTVRGAGYQLSE